MTRLIEPTDEERKNGWTAETLTAYLAERDKAATEKVLFPKPVKPAQANGRYSPFKWRG